jgi:hypothetical protein
LPLIQISFINSPIMKLNILPLSSENLLVSTKCLELLTLRSKFFIVFFYLFIIFVITIGENLILLTDLLLF